MDVIQTAPAVRSDVANGKPRGVPLLRRLCPYTDIPIHIILIAVGEIILLLALIIVPTYLVVNNPTVWNNPLAQFFFQSGAVLISVLIGWQLSTYPTERKGTAKWLPAARTACHQLLAMCDEVYRLRSTGKTTCDEICGLFGTIDEKERLPLQTIIRIKCEACKARLHDLENQVETTLITWKDFIEQNCQKGNECAAITRALRNRMDELEKKRVLDHIPQVTQETGRASDQQ